jgi:putative membrane protein
VRRCRVRMVPADGMRPGGRNQTHNGSADGDSAAGAGQARGESEPDARFTFANERTFLAWSRTSLALVVAGLAVVQLLAPFRGVPWGRHLIGTPLILLGAAVSVISYLEWKRNQRALRRGEPLVRSRLPSVLAVTIAVIAVIAVALSLYSAVAGT